MIWMDGQYPCIEMQSHLKIQHRIPILFSSKKVGKIIKIWTPRSHVYLHLMWYFLTSMIWQLGPQELSISKPVIGQLPQILGSHWLTQAWACAVLDHVRALTHKMWVQSPVAHLYSLQVIMDTTKSYLHQPHHTLHNPL